MMAELLVAVRIQAVAVVALIKLVKIHQQEAATAAMARLHL
jgi:hypothetical protein